MKNHNPIADREYICEHRRILKDLCIWAQMTDEEKQFFKQCHRCTKNIDTNPCETCKHRKTEIQVDNRMTELRRKYF